MLEGRRVFIAHMGGHFAPFYSCSCPFITPFMGFLLGGGKASELARVGGREGVSE
jgi:hypothetical protein